MAQNPGDNMQIWNSQDYDQIKQLKCDMVKLIDLLAEDKDADHTPFFNNLKDRIERILDKEVEATDE